MQQASRATALLHAFSSSFLHVRDQTLSMDLEGRKVPLCMSQYRRVFCSSRVPQAQRDKILCYNSAQLTEDERTSKTTEYVLGARPNHCIVMMRNRMYKLQVLTDDGSAVRSLVDIQASLQYIMELAVAPDAMPGPPVGVFTTGHRDAWHEAYQQLLDRGNGETLTWIQSAIIVLCLDTVAPMNPSDASRLILHGSGTNRWFDKHNLIVLQDGWAGMNFEHSVGDGATTLRVADYMCGLDAKRSLDDAVKQSHEAHALLQSDKKRIIAKCDELIGSSTLSSTGL